MRPITALIVVSLLLATTAVEAQQVRKLRPGIVDLDFRGGTVNAFVDAVRAAAPDVNVVVMPAAAAAPVPPMAMRAVDPGDALFVLQGMVARLPGGRAELTVRHQPQSGTDSLPITVISAEVFGERPETPPSMTRVLALAHILDGGLPADDLLTAVETALDLVAERHTTPAEVRFHEATGLLIIVGHRDQVHAIEQVIDATYENIRGRQKRQDKTNALNEAQGQVHTLTADLEVARANVNDLQNMVKQLQMENAMLQREVKEQHDRFAYADAQYTRAQQELALLRTELEQARSRREP